MKTSKPLGEAAGRVSGQAASVWQVKRTLYAFAVLVLAMASSPAVHAHFNLNTNIRIIHIETLADSLLVSMRMPAPLAFAEYVGKQPGDGKPIPFVTSVVEGGRMVHYLDKSAIRQDPDAFARFVADGYRVESNGEALDGEVLDLQIFAADKQTRFTNREEIRASFAPKWLFQTDRPQFVGDAVIDIQIRYPTVDPDPGDELRFSSTLASTLPENLFVANLFISYDGDSQRVTRATGLLNTPVVLNPSLLSAVKSFVVHGFNHILSGYDHVLFVLCLTIGAVSLSGLLWRVTGFTLGHTITLIAGFFGYVPKVIWFVPTVEIMIAASIIYVAIVALRKVGMRTTFVITTLIGMMHGLGFSFLLSKLLGPDSPHLVTSLLSFNLGIELGQLLIVSLVFVTLLSLARIRPSIRVFCERTIPAASMLIASWWLVERGQVLLQTI